MPLYSYIIEYEGSVLLRHAANEEPASDHGR